MLEALVRAPGAIRVKDITAAICLRLHAGNPWVPTRLEALSSYYRPAPRFMIVDFGSEPPFREKIEKICEASGFSYQHIPDYGVFSLSQARNAAATAAQTDYIYFTDIDFLTSSDFYSKLVKVAMAADMANSFDTILDLPAYHLSQPMTERLAGLAPRALSHELDKIAFRSIFQSFRDEVDFIAPYSNNFLISKAFFSYLGGYHSDFRGHGSEDFEFFIRTSLLSRYFPIPSNLLSDWDGPLKPGFFGNKPFGGFRSLNQLHAARAERFGLRAFHLWHPANGDNWRANNDWKRAKLNGIAEPYIKDNSKLLLVDSLPREKVAACVCLQREHYGYFLPLRTIGYRLQPVYDARPETLAELSRKIAKREIDSFCIFNPYMDSHRHFLPLFIKAKESGVETIVVERGALPQTVYYADDVSYASEMFSGQSLAAIKPSEREITAAKSYMAHLRTGRLLLENAEDRSQTDQTYAAFRSLKRRKIFIPLQLSDDMAVTKHVRESQRYDDFVHSIKSVAQANPKVLFLVKPHPLSEEWLSSMPQNILVANREDNVHSLIDSCDSVICYNSGVGLLAACHRRRIVTIGNAFYNVEGIGHFADDLASAVSMCLRRVSTPSAEAVELLIARYLFHRYSWFRADDVIRDFGKRRSHQYKNIRISRFVYAEYRKNLRWETISRPFSQKSYGFAMANFRSTENAEAPYAALATVRDTSPISFAKNAEQQDEWLAQNIKKKLIFRAFSAFSSPFMNRKLSVKLEEKPIDFFKDAKSLLTRVVAKLLLNGTSKTNIKGAHR